jgi:hypothetical protein
MRGSGKTCWQLTKTNIKKQIQTCKLFEASAVAFLLPSKPQNFRGGKGRTLDCRKKTAHPGPIEMRCKESSV